MIAIKKLHWGVIASVAVMMMTMMTGRPVLAAELLMFEREGCVWCARWNRDVGPVYAKTPEGQAAPLRRVDLDRTANPESAVMKPVRYTPTFVLIDNGREVGRITGYIGEDAFWGLLGKMLVGMDKPILRTDGVSATRELR